MSKQPSTKVDKKYTPPVGVTADSFRSLVLSWVPKHQEPPDVSGDFNVFCTVTDGVAWAEYNHECLRLEQVVLKESRAGFDTAYNLNKITKVAILERIGMLTKVSLIKLIERVEGE